MTFERLLYIESGLLGSEQFLDLFYLEGTTCPFWHAPGYSKGYMLNFAEGSHWSSGSSFGTRHGRDPGFRSLALLPLEIALLPLANKIEGGNWRSLFSTERQLLRRNTEVRDITPENFKKMSTYSTLLVDEKEYNRLGYDEWKKKCCILNLSLERTGSTPDGRFSYSGHLRTSLLSRQELNNMEVNIHDILRQWKMCKNSSTENV
jgi:hypothetical protein